nr:hypothetical protein [Tanacetum cinerariifolium]
MEDLKQQYLDELKCLSNLKYRDENKIAELTENFNGMSIEIRKKEKLLQLEQWAYLITHPSKCLNSFCYDDDDEDYTLAITPNESILSTEEPDNSLSMGDEHLYTISATKSDEFIKSIVENLIPIPSKSEGIPEHKCDVPFHDNSSPLNVLKDQFEDLSESNEEFSSTDDDSFSIDNIDYVDASPPDYELVGSEIMEIVIPEVGGIDADILLTIKDDILPENLLNVNHLFAKIEASNDNPTPFYDPIISETPPNLTPSGECDFFLEGYMLLLEAFLNDDHSSDFKTKSSSTSLNSLLDETTNFDNYLSEFTTFSKVLFDTEYKSDPSDDQSCSDEDVLEKIVSKSLRTHDSSLLISSKIDSLLEEFVGELTLLKLIPPGIDETDCDFEEDIRLIEKLLYDNSSLRPPEEFVSVNSDAKIKSFSPSPILIKNLFVKEYQEKDKIGSKTRQKWEAWRSREKSKAVIVNKERKTEENTSSKGQKCKILQVLLDERKRQGQICNFLKDTIAEWAYLSTHPSKRLHSFCYDDDDDEDYTSAITPDEPVFSTEEPDNSLSMGDKHLDTIPVTESDKFINSGVKTLISIPSESEGIPEHGDMLLFEAFLNDDLSSDFKTKSSSTFLNSLLEET